MPTDAADAKRCVCVCTPSHTALAPTHLDYRLCGQPVALALGLRAAVAGHGGGNLAPLPFSVLDYGSSNAPLLGGRPGRTGARINDRWRRLRVRCGANGTCCRGAGEVARKSRGARGRGASVRRTRRTERSDGTGEVQIVAAARNRRPTPRVRGALPLFTQLYALSDRKKPSKGAAFPRSSARRARGAGSCDATSCQGRPNPPSSSSRLRPALPWTASVVGLFALDLFLMLGRIGLMGGLSTPIILVMASGVAIL